MKQRSWKFNFTAEGRSWDVPLKKIKKTTVIRDVRGRVVANARKGDYMNNRTRLVLILVTFVISMMLLAPGPCGDDDDDDNNDSGEDDDASGEDDCATFCGILATCGTLPMLPAASAEACLPVCEPQVNGTLVQCVLASTGCQGVENCFGATDDDDNDDYSDDDDDDNNDDNDDYTDDDDNNDDNNDNDNNDDNDDTTPVVGYNVGNKMPNFSLTNNTGGTTTLYDYEGQVILLDSSAMWCPSCQDDTPLLQSDFYQVYREQGDGFIVLQLLGEDYNGGNCSVDELQAWAKYFGLTFPVLADTNWQVGGPLGNGYIPYYAVLDQNLVIQKKTNYLNTTVSTIENLLGIK